MHLQVGHGKSQTSHVLAQQRRTEDGARSVGWRKRLRNSRLVSLCRKFEASLGDMRQSENQNDNEMKTDRLEVYHL